MALLPIGIAASCAEPPWTTPLSAAHRPPAGPQPRLPERASFVREFDVPADRWNRVEGLPGVYAALVPELQNPFLAAQGATSELRFDGHVLTSLENIDTNQLPPAPAFRFLGSELTLLLDEEIPPPSNAKFRIATEAGRDGDRGWRFELGELASDGWQLVPEHPIQVETHARTRATLRWATSVQVSPDTDESRIGVFRVFANGQLVSEESQTDVLKYREIELPGGNVLLRFEVAGSGAAAFGLHNPVLFGPRVPPGDSAAAPKDDRPDIVLFSCDTFRADNMSAYGGVHGVTPNLDRLASEGLVFSESRASSSWTLPTHASLLFGVQPYQHTAVTALAQPPIDAFVTLAERLSSAGYRTVAVVDGLFVSRRYAMDRGFESFQELRGSDFARTLSTARAAFESSDGRPTFLFVHSYRVHAPYRVSEQTRREHGERLEIRSDYDSIVSSFWIAMRAVVEREGDRAFNAHEVLARAFGRDDWYQRVNELVREKCALDIDLDAGKDTVDYLKRLYLGAVYDFDRGFGEFWRALRSRPSGRRLNLLFTSDHGELFGEHSAVGHGRGVWDDVLRVPLVLWRSDQTEASGASLESATSVDVAPTICEMAGVGPAVGWVGRSLLRRSGEAVAYLFDCSQFGSPRGAVIERGLKVGFELEGEVPGPVAFAFDLTSDPSERRNIAGGSSSAIGEVLRRHAGRLRVFLTPLGASGRSEWSDADRKQLGAMGYASEAE